MTETLITVLTIHEVSGVEPVKKQQPAEALDLRDSCVPDGRKDEATTIGRETASIEVPRIIPEGDSSTVPHQASRRLLEGRHIVLSIKIQKRTWNIQLVLIFNLIPSGNIVILAKEMLLLSYLSHRGYVRSTALPCSEHLIIKSDILPST